MILDLLRVGGKLEKARFILASASPRRIELLRQIGIQDFEVFPSTFPEDLDKSSFDGPSAYVVENARRKAEDVWQAKEKDCIEGKFKVIIACDTVMSKQLSDRCVILEKPASRKEAFATLESFSASSLQVFSGFCVWIERPKGEPIVRTGSVCTNVHFPELPKSLIEAYLDKEDFSGMAGGYGIQTSGGSFTSKIDGCYFNVMGLPIFDLSREIRNAVLTQ